MTRDRRIALAECIRIILLLADAETPEARGLAAIISTRIKALGDGADAEPASEAQLANILQLAAALDLEPPKAIPIRTGPQLTTWDRGRVLAQFEEASGRALSANDPTPDSYIAAAQSLGMQPYELQSWIYDGAAAHRDWSTAALAVWASRYGFRRGPQFDESSARIGT